MSSQLYAGFSQCFLFLLNLLQIAGRHISAEALGMSYFITYWLTSLPH